MKFQKSQPAEAAQLVPFFCLVGPTEKYGCTAPPQKRTPTKCTKKLVAFQALACDNWCGVL